MSKDNYDELVEGTYVEPGHDVAPAQSDAQRVDDRLTPEFERLQKVWKEHNEALPQSDAEPTLKEKARLCDNAVEAGKRAGWDMGIYTPKTLIETQADEINRLRALAQSDAEPVRQIEDAPKASPFIPTWDKSDAEKSREIGRKRRKELEAKETEK